MRESVSSWVPNTKKQMKARGRAVFSNEAIRNYEVKCFLWYFIVSMSCVNQ